MNVKVQKEIKDGKAFITPHGVLVGGRETEILDNMLSEIENNGVSECTIDLSDIKWVNSPGIGCLLKGKNNFRKAGKDLKIININSRINNYLNLTKLSEYFN